TWRHRIIAPFGTSVYQTLVSGCTVTPCDGDEGTNDSAVGCADGTRARRVPRDAGIAPDRCPGVSALATGRGRLCEGVRSSSLSSRQTSRKRRIRLADTSKRVVRLTRNRERERRSGPLVRRCPQTVPV